MFTFPRQSKDIKIYKNTQKLQIYKYTKISRVNQFLIT